MRALCLAILVVTVGCPRHPKPAVHVEARDTSADLSAAKVPVATPVATTAPAPVASAPPAATTRFVSHMINGHVVIEEVALEPTPATVDPHDVVNANVPANANAGVSVDGANGVDRVPLVADGDSAESAAKRLFHAADLESDPSRKVDLLDRALAAAPSTSTNLRASMYAGLGGAYDAMNEGQNAIEAWEKVAELAPSVRGIEQHITSLKKRAGVERNFAHIAHEHFEVRFEGDAQRDLAESALKELDDAWRVVGDTLDLHPPAPITVIFYAGDKYQDATNAPDWSGGVFDGKIRIREQTLRIAHGELRSLLFHEYTHAVLTTSVRGDIPAWMHEGLAQHLEPAVSHAGVTTLKASGKDRLPPLGALHASFSRLDAKAARVAYASALDLVDMLAEWRGERSFADLFASMNKGKSFDDAIDDVYSLSPPLLESRWRARY